MQPTTRVGVTVTFLRLDLATPESSPAAALPLDTSLIRLSSCTVPYYRYLYATVGGAYCWWLRRSLSDPALDAILREPYVSVWVLYRSGEPAGFFELDSRNRPVVNLSYFGLMPHAAGQGMGGPFLDAAIEAARGEGARVVTVNTCTADHRRALPGYLRAGFRPLRSVREVWDVPNRLGLTIPEHLRL
ncbi:MAG TPA: GNAT family N-acetyltransferase [Acetobacteraceae bacterium]